MRQRWAGTMAITLARASQPPRPNHSHRTRPRDRHWCDTHHPHPPPTPLYLPCTTTIPPRAQGYVLKLPSQFLQQHGSKIRDGLTVLKLVGPTLFLTLFLPLFLSNPLPNPLPTLILP